MLTTAEAGTMGLSDKAYVAYALKEQRVIVTSDEDFLILSSQGVEHAGIVFFKQQTRTVKQVLRALFVLYAEFVPEEMMSRIEFL